MTTPLILNIQLSWIFKSMGAVTANAAATADALNTNMTHLERAKIYLINNYSVYKYLRKGYN